MLLSVGYPRSRSPVPAGRHRSATSTWTTTPGAGWSMAATMARLPDEQVRGARGGPGTVVFEPELVVRESA
ncbi:hypothetical protein ATE80_02495 [Streptomyces kanasensis]|uniref:Uncharacterized protein n=1 Tax=Streptomyces kanasensis TaxID=936756 RepID=A0A100Y9T4_9ACTN|nr:hypothetical protein ATE80_02495 [Streptomyces kanasensis]